MLSFYMSKKLGTYTGVTYVPQEGNTVDYSVNISYPDSTETGVIVADNTPRVNINRAKAVIVPLNGAPVLASAPDTEFATGDIRVRITRFM